MTAIVKWIVVDEQDGSALSQTYFLEKTAEHEAKRLRKQGFKAKAEKKKVLVG